MGEENQTAVISFQSQLAVKKTKKSESNFGFFYL
jgi:hypothetical protein